MFLFHFSRLRAAKWFHEFDIDNNQVLDFQEVRLAIRAARIELSDYELQETMEYIIQLPEHQQFHKHTKQKNKRVLNITEFTNLIIHTLEEQEKKNPPSNNNNNENKQPTSSVTNTASTNPLIHTNDKQRTVDSNTL